MKYRLILAAALLAAAMAGCAQQQPAAQPSAAQSTTVAQSPTPAPSTPQKAASALDVAQKIKAAVPTVTGITEITQANDANKLLGRPGQYTSGAWLTDTAGKPAATGVDGGAVVEVFATADDASTRSAYIQGQLKKLGPAYGTEYDYLNGPVLVRVSGKLTPDAAALYEAAIK